MFDDPEPELRVVDEGDGGFGSACDLTVIRLLIRRPAERSLASEACIEDVV
jgi:hypothetical protein